LGSSAPATVPSKYSHHRVELLDPEFQEYDKDTIYLIPSFKPRETDSDIDDPRLDTGSMSSEPQLGTSMYIAKGRPFDRSTE